MNLGLCLHPAVSLVENIGHDGSGKHCASSNTFDVRLAQQQVVEYNMDIREDQQALKEIMKFYNKNNRLIIHQLNMMEIVPYR